MASFTLSVVVLTFFLRSSQGFKYFQDRIPNGNSVPHPCKSNYIWHGVGHKNEGGGGSRNKFGEHFHKVGKKAWTSTLCKMDSDGDGKTNGQELGDPQCVWKPGQVPARTKRITHPGICEPLDSPQCKMNNQWEFCKPTDFTCDTIKQPGVRNKTFSLKRTKVPAVETSYYCAYFDLPQDGDYHVIATEPALDNRYVMHHMIMSGCPEHDKTLAAKYSTPAPCGMQAGNKCKSMGGWTLGSSGRCLENLYGIRIGKHGFKYALLQVHWNNPELKDDYYDASGLTIHYTSSLRPYDMGIFIVGQRRLEIPPGMMSHIVKGTCTQRCLKEAAQKSITLISGLMHMHYLGMSGYLELHHNGKKVRDLIKQDVFNYDNPIWYTFTPPAQLSVGDEIVLKCGFNSKKAQKTVYYGDSTSAEMCFSLISYYPASNNFSFCVNYGQLELCDQDITIGNLFTAGTINGCDFKKWQHENRAIITGVLTACDMTGNTCYPGCKETLSRALQHPCMQGDVGTFVMQVTDTYLTEIPNDGFVNAVHSCDTPKTTTQAPAGGASGTALSISFTFCASVLCVFCTF